MKTYKKLKREYEYDALDAMKCDICGKGARDPDGDNDWATGFHDTKEIDIKFKDGESYPGDYWGTTYSFDLCPECFMTKLIPWFKEQGATPQETPYNN